MKDNGRGTDNIVKGIGPSALEERARENNARVFIESSKGKGFFTSIIIERSI